MRSFAAAILLLVWTSVPLGTAAVRLLTKPFHCHCPGHKLPNGPAYSPCATSQVSAVVAAPPVFIIPTTVWLTLATAQKHPDTYLPPKPGPRADIVTPPPKV